MHATYPNIISSTLNITHNIPSIPLVSESSLSINSFYFSHQSRFINFLLQISLPQYTVHVLILHLPVALIESIPTWIIIEVIWSFHFTIIVIGFSEIIMLIWTITARIFKYFVDFFDFVWSLALIFWWCLFWWGLLFWRLFWFCGFLRSLLCFFGFSFFCLSFFCFYLFLFSLFRFFLFCYFSFFLF